MKPEHYQFVTEYLRWGDRVIAYKNAYRSDSSYQTLESAANRLLKRPDVAQAIEEAQAAIRQQVEAEVAEQLKGELLTIQKKRELLYKIATGEMMAEQNYKGKDCNVCTQFVRPSITQMLRAIDLDSKLANHYPQTKSWGNTSQHKPTPVPEPVLHETNKNSPQVIRRGDVQTPASVCDRGGLLAEQTSKVKSLQQTGSISPIQGDRGMTSSHDPTLPLHETNKDSPPQRGVGVGLLANKNRQHVPLREGGKKTLKAPPSQKQKHEKTQQITTNTGSRNAYIKKAEPATSP